MNGAGELSPQSGRAEFLTLSKRRSLRPQVSQAAATPKVVLIGFGNIVGFSSPEPIGSIHRHCFGLHRSLVRTHPA
jgi:hypothetical protein